MKNLVINTEHGYQEIKPIEGYVVTKYVEGVDDIKDYYSTTEIDAPMDADISAYRAVTLEQNAKYKAEQTKAFEAEKAAREVKEAKERKAQK